MNQFADYQAFVAVVEAGSFSAAGERLSVAKSLLSRRVSQLEKRLGTRLLNRTTRRISLTESGRNFYQRVRQILTDVAETEQDISAANTEIRGLLKLAAPLSFGLRHLSGVISEFLLENPAIELNLDLNDRQLNLVEEGFDLAIRIGVLEDSTLIARRLGRIRHLTCASPAYLQAHGEPQHPDDLKQHVGMQYSHVSSSASWRYQDSQGRKIQAHPQLRIHANNGEALAAAATAGLGLVSGPDFILADFVRRGDLQQVLARFSQLQSGLYAVYPPGRLIPKRVQVFSDFLADRFGDSPYWRL